MKTRSLIALGLLLPALVAACGGPSASNGSSAVLRAQHGGPGGAGGIGTVGAYGALGLVGEASVRGVEPGLIADLAGHPGQPYAYLARWGGTKCAGPETGGRKNADGGAYVIDLSDPARPQEVGFIPVHQDVRVGEGMQVVRLDTAQFRGDVLVMNHEGCGKNYKAGFSLVDVSNPRKPVKLAMHEGDYTREGLGNRPHDANQYHSAFAWNAGGRAYLVATDNEERLDVDLYDVTNPKKPRLVAELDLNAFGVAQPELALTQSFLHDMVVKEIGGRQVMVLSYWDGGYVLLNVDNPAAPVFLGDSDYPAVDAELLAATGVSLRPEGNGHQAEFTADNRFVIATDEDFDPLRLVLTTAAGTFPARLGTNTTAEAAEVLAGAPATFVGRACNGDPAVGAGSGVAVVERGLCTFEEKAQNVLAAGGYAGLVIMNREGADACLDVFTPSLTAPIPTALIGRDAGLALFGKSFDYASCADATPQSANIPLGQAGASISAVATQFDGWGYVRLFGLNLGAASGSLTELDTFVVPEAMDPDYASGFGDLSVHEVATDPVHDDLAYLSYYGAGVRAVQVQCAGPTSCQLVEVGGYTNPASSFWGIETWNHPNGTAYVLASDRNSGIKVFRSAGHH